MAYHIQVADGGDFRVIVNSVFHLLGVSYEFGLVFVGYVKSLADVLTGREEITLNFRATRPTTSRSSSVSTSSLFREAVATVPANAKYDTVRFRFDSEDLKFQIELPLRTSFSARREE